MSTVHFIHTSDIHLDTSFSGSGLPPRLGERKRAAIRGTFRRILDDARETGVQLVFIAGDLFEHDRVTPDSVEFLKQQLAGLEKARVFIAPGNHDPFIHGSPYWAEDWPPNVHIFQEEMFQSVELADLGVRVTGFGFTHNRLEERLFLKLPVLTGDLINIVVAHASDVGRAPSGKVKHGPFTIDEVAGKNVQYCALGHYHQQHEVENSIDSTQVWYSGIPEGRGWDEEGACGYLFGEINEGKVRVEGRTRNRYPLRTLSLNCDGFSSREQIVDAILRQRGSAFDAETILRIRFEGTMDSKVDLSVSDLEERLAGEAQYFVWQDETQPALDFEAISKDRTLQGRFVRLLNERIASAAGEERAVLERARLYGVQALMGRAVRLR